MGIKIGELAERTGCKVVTVRYYEKEGLLRPPSRTGGNYRLYSDDDVERLEFIMRCRRHDMSLEEIRRLLSFQGDEYEDCVWVSELVDEHIAGINKQIVSLKKLKSHLEKLRASCGGGANAASCRIMKGLEAACSCTSEKTIGAQHGS